VQRLFWIVVVDWYVADAAKPNANLSEL